MPTQSEAPTQTIAVDPPRVGPGSGATRLDRSPGRDVALARGTAVGRYLVLERLGSGGMGVVYSAYDPELERKVALKLLRVDAGGSTSAPHARARLLREAQAMAKLSHPNVLPVYDVGTHAEQIFIALEHIEGQTLTDWLLAERPPWRRTLEVFRAAGRGLAAAHAAGLVHRDFKPDNVLIAADGRARVLDFGLARAPGAQGIEGAPAVNEITGEASSGMTAEALTQTGTVMGTPAYMAPEQRRGDAVDAKADQFSFCVALYAGLYGERPFSGQDAVALLKAINAGKIHPAPRGSRVPGWLRPVVVRGLAAQPDRRWPTMDALLTQLGRDPARTWRRVGGATAAAAVVVIAAFGYAGARADVCGGADEQLAGVWDDARRAELGTAFANSGISYATDTGSRAQALLDRYATGWIGARADACQATRVRQDQSEALMDLRIACLDKRRAQLAAVVDVLSRPDPKVVEKAVHTVAQLPALGVCSDAEALSAAVPPPADPTIRDQVEDLRTQLARARALHTAGKFAEARAVVDTIGPPAKQTGYGPLLAELGLLRGMLQAVGEQFDDAAATQLEALALAEGHGMDRLAARIQIQMLWVVGLQQANHTQGELWGRLAEAKVARLDGDPKLEVLLLGRLFPLADAQAQYDRARGYATRAVTVWKELDTDDPAYVTAIGNLGSSHYRAGEFDEARDLFQRAVEAQADAVGPEHPDYARTLSNLSAALHALGEYEAARSTLEEAVEVFSQALGPDHFEVGVALSNLASVHFRQDHFELAVTAGKRSVEIKERGLGPNHPKLGYSYNNLAMAQLALLRYPQAEQSYQRALEIFERALGPEHPAVIEPLLGLGETRVKAGQPAQAVELLERALELEGKTGGDDLRKAPIRIILANAVADSDPKAAVTLAQQARDAFAAAGDEKHERDAAAQLQRLQRLQRLP